MKQPYFERATYTDLIISHLLSCKSMSLQTKILKDLIDGKDKREQKVFYQSLYRLKKQGFVKLIKDNINFDYKKYIDKKSTSMYFKKEENTDGVMIMFDIPEEKRKTRDWLRNQLKLWDFKMIQQSVWFGKGKLTEDFKSHLDLLGIKKNIKIFSAVKIKI